MKKKFRLQSGFTFIELLLYISIVTIVLIALIPYAWSVIEGSAKNANQREVFSQARYVSELIKYEIRNATGINNVAATSISLVKSAAADNPAVIDLLSGKIRIKKGAQAVVNLNSNDTTVSTLTFTDYRSADNKTWNIQYVFTIDDTGASVRQEYKVPAVTVEGAAEVRSNPN